MDGGHLFKERECGHKRLLFFNAHRFREAKGWRVIRKGMPWLYAFHATGVVSLPHFNFLHSNFYLVLSHNHKCFCVVTQPSSGRNLPILWSGCIPVAALSAFLCRPKIHIKHGKQWQRARGRGSAERNTTRTMLHASAEETDPPLSDAFLLRPCGDSITYSPRKGSMKDPSKTKKMAIRKCPTLLAVENKDVHEGYFADVIKLHWIICMSIAIKSSHLWFKHE